MAKKKYFRKRGKGSLKKAVKSIVSSMAETKTALATMGSQVSDVGDLSHLTDIAQGDTQATREGNQIFLKGITVRLHAAKADSTNIVRLLVVRGRTSSDDIAIDDFPAGAGDYPFIEEMNYDKFEVVRDMTFTLGSAREHVVKKFYIKVNKKIQYDASGSGNVSVNPYYIHLVSDSDVSTHPYITMTTRLYWKDF